MKKILIIAIIATWIAIYPNFCSALQWYNFKTTQFETIEEKILDYSSYIPQDTASQGLYQIYIEMDNTPLESAIKVLKIHTD